MINLANILKALHAQINMYHSTQGMEVERSTYANTSDNVAKNGWIGIYPGPVRYEPRTLGRGALNDHATIEIKIIVQAASSKSGEDCETLLEQYTKNVVDAIYSDCTIKGEVDIINGMTVEPIFDENNGPTLYMQNRIIKLSAEKQV